jgi:hypothetical protein
MVVINNDFTHQVILKNMWSRYLSVSSVSSVFSVA